MFARACPPTHAGKRRRAAVLFVVAPSLLAGCASVAPALTNLAVAFAQDLLAAVSVNYSPRYATQVEELLVALAREASSLPLEAQLANSGYRPPPPEYARRPAAPPGQYPDPYAQDPYAEDPYAQDPYAQDPYAQDPYAQDPYAQGGYQDPYGQPQGGYQDPYAQGPPAGDEDPYAQGGYQDPYATGPEGGYADPYAQESPSYDPYAQGASAASAPRPAAEARDPYAYGTPRLRAATAPITMNAVLLAQRAGSDALIAIEDGETLRDGRGDPARGDRLKVAFQVNCTCHVYVLGIDATGYVASIFPDPDDPALGNPVQAGTQYVLPRGDDWWGLDDFRGVEQVYFVASHAPRQDIEDAMRALGNQPRQVSAQAYRPVGAPAVVPTRGMVKVSAPRQVSVQSGSVAAPVMAATFEAGGGQDLVVTRWFRHE